MNFEINKTYAFNVVDICCTTNGFDYLLVSGPNGKLCKVYNIIKYQYVDVPEVINCIVKDKDQYGDVRLVQDECSVLKEHYALDHYYTFRISDKKSDNNGNSYYVLDTGHRTKCIM